jgi:superfamily I DNA and/or RNA helicase
MLLTAQSNAAIDHLMGELEHPLKPNSAHAPLVVRCRAKDKAEGKSVFEIGDQAERMLNLLLDSALISEATPSLRQKLGRMSKQPDERTTPRKNDSNRRIHPMSPEYNKRSFEGLILRAANVVFATTNSGELERLIEERGQFDWSIVEEAGKATGGELLPPLLLSHRRLMIGDHKQLPPYRSHEMSRLLENPVKVRQVVRVAGELISRSLRDADMEELLDEIEEEDADLASLCADAMNTIMLFETLVEREFSRQIRNTRGRPIARRLDTQHRMHPAIARVVSRCFYGGTLTTDVTRQTHFTSATPPFEIKDQKCLPSEPIVVVGTKYVQAAVGERGGDQRPSWKNPSEVDVVIDVLAQLSGRIDNEKQPTLAILSPYTKQVALLDQEVERQRNKRLLHLSSFKSATKTDSFCSTVDAFQGSQADVVVVSLVRNNQHTSPAKALGFLRDSRRMNVLLSRARWKLILVGSIDFLRAITDAIGGDEAQECAFLGELIAALDAGKKSGEVAIITPDALRGKQP